MKWWLAFVLLLLWLAWMVIGCVAVSAAGPRVWVGVPDWFDFQPDAPLVSQQFYIEPYASVIRVGDVALIDGSRMLVIEAIRGNPCGTDPKTKRPRQACLWPEGTLRGYWFPVEVTIEPVSETR